MASYQAILATLRRLDDEAARGPSLLPGWSRAHVLTHLARHADSHVRMLKGLRDEELIPQYAGGDRSRRREIERGAGRKGAALVDDFRRANETLFAVWEDFPADLWERPVDAHGGRRPAAMLAWARWRELEVHHVDLDLGFDRNQWPLAFVMTALKRTFAGLPLRRTESDLVAGRWQIETTDRPGRWLVVADPESDEPVRVVEDELVADADGRVAGTAADVLAWLLGRLPADALGIEGSTTGARLPELFPYP